MIKSATARIRQAARTPSLGSIAKHTLLRQGASGAEVKQLQRAMNAAGAKVPVSGTFDERTEAAVRKYQRAKGLQVDGVVGQQTWGSFVGKSYPPGSDMLAGAKGAGGARGTGGAAGAGGAHPHPHPAAGKTPGKPTIQGPGDSYESGPGKAVTAYVNGQPRTIKVVPVGNGQYMRADAAKSFGEMTSAARRAGINLGATSGFRTMAEQTSLWNQFGRNPVRVARPGTSNHQNGIAMDISGVGGRGTRADSWLRANATKFGFKNYPAEFWHYDYVR